MSIDHSGITSTYMLHFEILAMIKDVEESKAIICRFGDLYCLPTIWFLLHVYLLSYVSLFLSLVWEHHTIHSMGWSIRTILPTRKDQEVLRVSVPEIVWKMDKIILLDYSIFFFPELNVQIWKLWYFFKSLLDLLRFFFSPLPPGKSV